MMVIRNRFPIVETWTRISTSSHSASVKGKSVMAETEEGARSLLTFIEAQTKRLKKTEPEEISELKLSRAVAAMADLTDEAAPDDSSAVFLTAWKRTDQCHHFWGPTVGNDRFCTKCQVPRGAVAPDEDANPIRRRS
jgi:hypothetical protein